MRYFDPTSAVLDRRAFASKAVFAREAQAIFGTSWVFAGPAECVARPGDFYTGWIGPEPMVLWRAPSGALRVFANRCPMGVRPLAAATRGHATTFVCGCHGQEYAENDLDPLGAWLTTTFRGMVFAARRQSSEPFDQSLAPFRSGFDALLGAECVRFDDPEPVRWRVRANWKIAIDAWCGPQDPPPETEAVSSRTGFQMATTRGVAAFAGEDGGGARDDPWAGLKPVCGVLFPNLAYDAERGVIHVCHPLAPSLTEIHTFALRSGRAPRARGAPLPFGPGADRGRVQIEAWEAISAGSARASAQGAKVNLQRGLGGERDTNLPGLRGDFFSETNARAFFGWWQARLDGPRDPTGSQGLGPAARSRRDSP